MRVGEKDNEGGRKTMKVGEKASEDGRKASKKQ